MHRDALNSSGAAEDHRPGALPAAPEARARRGPGFAACVGLVILYLLPGLIGHDPWKQDETYIADIVHTMLGSGDLAVPTMAGEPFMEKPPLYYWVAAACARLFAPVLQLHDGARLANLLFMGLTCALLAGTARRSWQPIHAGVAPLLLLACLGMETHAHLMLTDLAMLPGFALALYALALCHERPAWGGVLLGIGVGIGFLAKGMFAPGVIGACALLLPACFKEWRQPSYRRTLALAFAAALPWLLAWPLEIYWRSPRLFVDWFWLNNVGRFIGFSVPMLGAAHDPGFWLRNLPWFTFPALPLALLTLWRGRARLLADTRLQLPLTLGAVLAAVLALSASARGNYALPLLLPLSLLAVPSAVSLPAALDRYLDWAARIGFGSLAALMWLMWSDMAAYGAPPAWPVPASVLAHEFASRPDVGGAALGAGATLAAIALGKPLLAGAGRGLYAWVTGLALCWALLSTLLLPWIDYSKSYRTVYTAIRAALPPTYRCIGSAGLGESERAMLDYYLGIATWRREAGAAPECDVLLVNGFKDRPPRDIDPARWALVWQGARPGDSKEGFWLFSGKTAHTATHTP